MYLEQISLFVVIGLIVFIGLGYIVNLLSSK
jgi:hypothetical protein